jgi:hypothetical protein
MALHPKSQLSEHSFSSAGLLTVSRFVAYSVEGPVLQCVLCSLMGNVLCSGRSKKVTIFGIAALPQKR